MWSRRTCRMCFWMCVPTASFCAPRPEWTAWTAREVLEEALTNVRPPRPEDR